MGLFKRRKPVQVEMQHPVAEPSWMERATAVELEAVDAMLRGHLAEPKRDDDAIDKLLAQRLKLTHPGQSS